MGTSWVQQSVLGDFITTWVHNLKASFYWFVAVAAPLKAISIWKANTCPVCGPATGCLAPHSIGPCFLNMSCQGKQRCYASVLFNRVQTGFSETLEGNFSKNEKLKTPNIIFPDLVQINEGIESADIIGCDWWKSNLEEIKTSGRLERGFQQGNNVNGECFYYSCRLATISRSTNITAHQPGHSFLI